MLTKFELRRDCVSGRKTSGHACPWAAHGRRPARKQQGSRNPPVSCCTPAARPPALLQRPSAAACRCYTLPLRGWPAVAAGFVSGGNTPTQHPRMQPSAALAGQWASPASADPPLSPAPAARAAQRNAPSPAPCASHLALPRRQLRLRFCQLRLPLAGRRLRLRQLLLSRSQLHGAGLCVWGEGPSGTQRPRPEKAAAAKHARSLAEHAVAAGCEAGGEPRPPAACARLASWHGASGRTAACQGTCRQDEARAGERERGTGVRVDVGSPPSTPRGADSRRPPAPAHPLSQFLVPPHISFP